MRCHSGRCGPEAVSNAIACEEFYSRSLDAVIRVYDKASNVIENGLFNNRWVKNNNKEKQNDNEKTRFLRHLGTGELARAGHNSISKSKPYYQWRV